jgi:hypothetical protein
MSYDVYIGNESHNYTSNMSGLFNEIILDESKEFDKGLHVINGMSGYQTVPILKEALRRAHYHDHIEGFDAANGWGTAHGGLMFLARIAIDCAMNPYETITISY